jgi:hypothetical protein
MRRPLLGPSDLRALGLFRITFGLATLSSIIDLEPFLRVGLSDEGFWPRSAAFAVAVDRFSLMDVSGPPWVAYGYWILTVASCIAFVVGWHSRIATFATFVLATGMMERTPDIFEGSDHVIRVLLFWTLFAPVGNWYSVDAALARARGSPLPAAGDGIAFRLAGMQLSWIYLCTFLRKLPGASWRNGTAVSLALGLEHDFTRPLGHLMRTIPWTTTTATYFTLAVEAAFLPLVLLPFGQPWARAIALASGFVLHLGIWVTMCIGAFSWVMVGAYPILFEPGWVDWVVARVAPIGNVLWRGLIALPWGDRLRAFGRALVENGREADCDPATRGRGFWSGRFPAALALVTRRCGQGVLVALFIACVWSSAPLPRKFEIPERLSQVVRRLELWQEWSMFSPDPFDTDLDLQGDGKLVDGTDVDVLRGDETHGPLPPSVHGFFSTRWPNVTGELASGDPTVLLEFGRFLCGHWNRSDRPAGRALLARFRLSLIGRKVSAQSPKLGPPRTAVLWDHVCLDSSATPLPHASSH